MHLKIPGGAKNMSMSVHEHVELKLLPESIRKQILSFVVKMKSVGDLIPLQCHVSVFKKILWNKVFHCLDTNQKIRDPMMWRSDALLADRSYCLKPMRWFGLFHSMYAVRGSTVSCVQDIKRLTKSEGLNFIFQKFTFYFFGFT